MAGKQTGKTTKKKPAKKQTRASTAHPRDVESMRRRNQISAIILFALSIVLLFLIFIKGELVWMWIHDFILGMFGFLSLFVPVLMGYIAVTLATGKKSKPRTIGRTVLIFVTVALACSIAYVFQYGDIQHGQNFFSSLGDLYMLGIDWRSAGLFSGLIGYPIVAMLGVTGAKIVSIVAFCVSLMLLTGTTLMQVFRAVAKPAKKAGQGVAKAAEVVAERREEKREEKRVAKEKVHEHADVPIIIGREDDIDIAMDGEDREAEMQKKSQQKLENLKKAFTEPYQPEVMPEPGVDIRVDPETGEVLDPIDIPLEEPAVQPVKQKASAKPQPVAFEEEYVDVFDIPLPGDEDAPVEPMEEAPKAAPVPMTAPVQKAAPAKPAAAKAEPAVELEDVGAAAAAEAFVKKMKENQAQELETAVEAQEEKETYRFPPLDLLKTAPAANQDDITLELQTNGQKLVEVLKSFGVQTRILDISRGPAVTRYELQPAAGVKISKITNLSDDIAMNLAASGVRIEAPIPGKAAVGVEVPNQNVSVVKMRELIESAAFQNAKSKLTVALGRDISGQITLADLAKMPHLLIAGSTGSGKSVCINSLIISLLYKASPDEVKLLMVDPKVVELGIYNGIPHLLVPVVTDPRKAAGALGWAVTEMLNRYKVFADNNVRDLHGYNEMVGDGLVREDGVKLERMPQIVIIIDELADLMMAAPNDVEDSICRLAQMARAAGMHLVIATQRPSVDVITGVIKANIPSRIAFAVSSQIDSRTILDGSGAEKLLGRGDMLFAPVGSPKPVRVQGCFVDDKEVEKVTSYVKKKHDTDYDKSVIEEIEKNAAESKAGKEEAAETGGISTDPMMPEAIKCVVEAGQASTSLLQRRLRLGYARAGRLIDEMEQMGIVGPHEGSKPRQVLLTYQQYLEMQMQQNGETVAAVNEDLE